MASNGKRMVKEDLINYLEAVQTNYPDPSDIGGGGTDFTPTNGLEFTEVEGETYLGLTQATSDKINGAISENSDVDGRLIFNARNYNNDDICPIALNLRTADSSTTGTNKTSTGILFGFYAGDEKTNYGKIQFNRNNWSQFSFGEMINGSYAYINFPAANKLLENDWPVSRTVGLGAKVGSTTVYAGNDGVIDLSSQITPSKKIYTISFAPDDEEENANIIGISDVELEEPDMDGLMNYYTEYTSGVYVHTTQEFYQGEIDKLANILKSLDQIYEGYVPFYYNTNSSTPGTVTNLVLSVTYNSMKVYESGTAIVNLSISKVNNVNTLTLTYDNTKLNYVYVYLREH